MGFGDWRWGTGKGFSLRYNTREHFSIRSFVQGNQDKAPSRSTPPEVSGTSQPHFTQSANRHACQAAADQDAGKHRRLTRIKHRLDKLNGRECQSPQPAVIVTPQEPVPTANGVSADKAAWRKQYDQNLDNIQDYIHAVAAAVAMLDSIEYKVLDIDTELQRIRDNNLRVDCDKVVLTLQFLVEYVNDAIRNVDGQCTNLLRDSKVEIRFTELGGGDKPIAGARQSNGVSLTMISISKFLDIKIKKALANGLIEDEIPQFIQGICATISSNIQILTSVMLALFATRDYTQAVTKLAARENVVPTISTTTNGELPASTINRMQIDNIDQQIDIGRDQIKMGRTSLAELLEHVRAANRHDDG